MSMVQYPDIFTEVELTDLITRGVKPFGDTAGMFSPMRIEEKFFGLVEREGALNMVPSTPPGSPHRIAVDPKDKMRLFSTQHHGVEAVVKVAGLTRDMWTREIPSIAQATAEKLLNLRGRLDRTREFKRMGALKGIIVDGDGTTELRDLYDAFDITRVAWAAGDTLPTDRQAMIAYFNFSSATSPIGEICRSISDHVLGSLVGESATGVEAWVSEEFFNSLISHATVKTAYANWSNSFNEGKLSGVFTYHDITFRKKLTRLPNDAGVSTRLIAAGEGHAFPVGTSNLMKEVFSPREGYGPAVNTPGQEFYVTQRELPHGEGVELRATTDSTAYVTQPQVLVKCLSVVKP